MLNLDRVHKFFHNFGFDPRIAYKPISAERYYLILEVAKTWFDRSFSAFVMGCFVGTEQNANGSYSAYVIQYPDDDEILTYLHAQWSKVNGVK